MGSDDVIRRVGFNPRIDVVSKPDKFYFFVKFPNAEQAEFSSDKNQFHIDVKDGESLKVEELEREAINYVLLDFIAMVLGHMNFKLCNADFFHDGEPIAIDEFLADDLGLSVYYNSIKNRIVTGEIDE